MNALVDFCRAKRQTLISTLTLATSDTYDGERAGAFAAAGRLIKAAKLTWDDLIIDPDTRGHRPPPPPRAPAWRDDLHLISRFLDHVTPWEQQFTTSIAHQTTLSPKQQAVLEKIARSLRDRGFE